MATIASLIVDVAANTVKLTQDVQKVNATLDTVVGYGSKIAGALVAGFSVNAVIGFATQAAAAASGIKKMADQTGLSVIEVQRLNYIAGQSDTSIASLIGAVQNLQQRLGDDSTGAAGAFKRLGIQADAFNRLSTYTQMTTLGTAIQAIKDPTDQASIAAAIFGKTWKEILPAIKSGMQEVGAQAPVMSQQTVESLDRIDDALARARAQGQAWGGSLVLAFEGAGFALGDYLSRFSPSHFGIANSQILKHQEALVAGDGLKGALASVKPAIQAVGDTTIGMAMSFEEARKVAKTLDEQAKASIEVNKKAAEEARRVAEDNKRFRDSVESLTSSAVGARVAFGAYGALLPDLSSQTVQFTDRTVVLASAIDATTESVDALGRAGLHTSAVLAGMGSDALIGQLMPALEGSSAAIREATTQAKGFGTQLIELFTNTSKKVGEWQDALTSKITGLFGGKEGGLMGSIVGGGMNLIFGPAGGLITSLMSQGMAKMADLAWTGLKKIGGFFKDLFGGPSAQELAGREVVAAFEQHLSTMLTDAQRMEAGNDAWKQTVIVVRDAYLALGKTEAEALAAVDALWKSSKGGADAVRDAMKPIEDALNGVGRAAGSTIGVLNRIPRTIPIDITYHDPGTGSLEAPEGLPGFASGTGGRFLDFGRGTPVMLHGKERVVTEAEGRSSGRSDLASLREEMYAQRVFLEQIVPKLFKASVQQAAA